MNSDKTESDKKAQLALRRSEEKFRRLVEGLSGTHCVFSHSPEGVFSYVSAGFKTVFGYEPEEFIGRNWRDLKFTEESMLEGNRADNLIAANGSFQSVELVYNHPDSKQHYVSIIYGPVYENGKIIAMEGVCEDVTERRLVQEDLQKSEERYRSIVAVLNAGVWEYHNDTGYLWCSDEYFTMLGYAPGSLGESGRLDLQCTWARLLHPDDCEEAARHFADYLALGQAGLYENRFRLRHRNGTYLWVWSRGKTLLSKDGSVSPITVGIHIDISEQTRVEQALRESEQRYREIFNATSEAIFIIDAATLKVLDVNEPTVKMYGCSSKEPLLNARAGKFSSNVHPYTEEEAEKRMRMTIAGNPQRFDWHARKLDGELFPVEVALSYSIIGGQKLILSVVRDVTETKKLLESAQRADKLESLGILAGGIAHDFNNLLGGIYGYLELAMKAVDNPEAINRMEACLNTMGRARSLTQQLLTFAKGGSPDCKIQPFFPFVEETVKFALSGSNVSASFKTGKDLLAGCFDKAQLEQVIDNIVINAVQSMQKGGIIEVSTSVREIGENEHPVLAAGKYVQISFKDQGSGIPREIMPRIFDPFFSTKSGGHGLGLTTCYSIIKNHNGCIDVDSEPGLGSTFHVFVPAAYMPAHKEIQQSGDLNHRQGLIVIMDDESVIRATTSLLLESFGYSVVCAADGKEVLALLKEGVLAHDRLSALIFDLTVPGGMGGLETLKEVRKLGCDSPAIVMSGYSEDRVMTNPTAHGFSASIRKPFTTTEMGIILKNCFRK